MKYATDFRSLARNALSGRWTIAVIACLIATLLGAVGSSGPELELNFDDSGANFDLEFAGHQIYTFNNGWSESLNGIIVGSAAFIIVIALAIAVAYFILGSVVDVGYSRFNLDLVGQQKEPEIATLFGYFKYWKTAIAANFLQ